MSDFLLSSWNANPLLAASIADQLEVRLEDCTVQRFPDGKVSINLNESVRRKEVFLIQPTTPPVNDHLFELLGLADARVGSRQAYRIRCAPYRASITTAAAYLPISPAAAYLQSGPGLSVVGGELVVGQLSRQYWLGSGRYTRYVLAGTLHADDVRLSRESAAALNTQPSSPGHAGFAECTPFTA